MVLTKRLAAAAKFVRPGVRVADIGSDHAKLPIYLVEKGIASRALASDINRQPAERSERAVRSAGLADRITVTVADGLDGIEAFAPDDIVIAGMGGELIWEIISASDYPKKDNVRLILQPMTKAAQLRRSLYENGYGITEEALVDEGKIYQIICAVYIGAGPRRVPDEVLLVGEKNMLCGDRELLVRHIDVILAGLDKRINGLLLSGQDARYEQTLKEKLRLMRDPYYEESH